MSGSETPLSFVEEFRQSNNNKTNNMNLNEDPMQTLKTPTSIITPVSGELLSSQGTESSKRTTSNNSPSQTIPNSLNSHSNGSINRVIPTSIETANDGESNRKVDINQIDADVSKILDDLEHYENSFREADSQNSKEITNIINSLKSTVLRLNLKNTLVKNQLLEVKDDYTMERCILLNKIENLEKTLRIIQDENNAVNSRNLKLIKYIRTLKNEKIKSYIAENKRLREIIERLENGNPTNSLNALRINHPQRYSSIPSPLNTASSIMPQPSNNQYGTLQDDESEPYRIRQQLQSPTNFNMLDTLGRLATEYLHNEYPDEDKLEHA